MKDIDKLRKAWPVGKSLTVHQMVKASNLDCEFVRKAVSRMVAMGEVLREGMDENGYRIYKRNMELQRRAARDIHVVPKKSYEFSDMPRWLNVPKMSPKVYIGRMVENGIYGRIHDEELEAA